MATSEDDARHLAIAREKSTRGKLETQGVRLTDEEVDAILEGFEKEDDSEKTWTRRIVENHLSQVGALY